MKRCLLPISTIIATVAVAQEGGRYRDNINQNEFNVVVDEQTTEIAR